MLSTTAPTTTAPTASPPRARSHRAVWGFAITSVATFMAALDNLVVTTARSALAALAPSVALLVMARAVQGAGGAGVMPLALTLLSAAVPPERRNLALGGWGAISGLAVAAGPVVGGAIVSAFSWQWIFWLNVPIGLVLVPLALTRLEESHGPARPMDRRGVILASAGLFGVVLALVRSTSVGWSSPEVYGGLAVGLGLVAAFLVWETRTPEPMLPLRLFRSRAFSAANAASLFMSFGMFGSIFLPAQFLQIVQHESPVSAGLHTLPWTAVPVLVAPLGGILTDRIGGRAVLTVGLTLQAVGLLWIGLVLAGAVAAFALPRRRPAPIAHPEVVVAPAATPVRELVPA